MTPPLVELHPDDLRHVTGGFLPLLGLIGAGATQILGGIGKKKQKEAEDIMAKLQASGQTPPGQLTAPRQTANAPEQ